MANGQRRHVDGYAGGRGSSPTRRMRGAGVKMNRNVAAMSFHFSSSFFFAYESIDVGKIKLSVMSDRGKWDDRYQVSRQKRVFLWKIEKSRSIHLRFKLNPTLIGCCVSLY